jgi:hypothetical protein
MAETDTSIETQLSWHLTSNHYPPLPSAMVAPCIDAINAYNDGDPDEAITLPEGVTFKDNPTAPAHEIIEAHHLDAWLDQGEW